MPTSLTKAIYTGLLGYRERDFRQEYLDTVRLLVGRGVDVHSVCDNGKNALHLLLSGPKFIGHFRKATHDNPTLMMARILTEAGGNRNAMDDDELLPLGIIKTCVKNGVAMDDLLSTVESYLLQQTTPHATPAATRRRL